MTDKTQLFMPYMPQCRHAEPWGRHPAIDAFRRRFNDSQPHLDHLIRLGKHQTAPALVLTDQACEALVDVLSPRCKGHTREALSKKLSRTLGTLPHFWWAGRLVFDVTPGGQVLVTYHGGDDPKQELKEMRTCILRS